MEQVDIEKCRLMYYPAEVLGQLAKSVEKIDDNIRQLVEKMRNIMFDVSGRGIAAPQVGILLRLFLIRSEPDNPDSRAVNVYINPTIVTGEELNLMNDGCLSLPGVPASIIRHKHCKVTASDLDGNEFTEEAEGVCAMVIQHEYDHLDGMTIVDRMDKDAKIAVRKQLDKLKRRVRK